MLLKVKNMKLQKLLLGLLILSAFSLPFNSLKVSPVYAQTDQIVNIEAKPIDKRAQILKDYLAKHNSPLENSAQDFIDAADHYGLDWKLVVSISGVESTFGKHIPGGYNGWGWGVYGDNAIYFKSWRDAIFTISQGLRERYVDRGYTEPYSMNRIYAASPTWGQHVSFFMNDIDKFAQTYPFDVELADIEYTNDLPQTRGLKTELANNIHDFNLDVLN